MDPVTLARIQFAFTVAYHFLFVPISLGTALMLVIAERRYYRSGDAGDRATSDLFKRLFAVTFAIGVATGITMEFAFGMNWATYSRFVGDIFGAPLAAEAVLAFFLESTFLGVLLYGRQRVSKRFYYVSTWLVLLGSHLSALWIIIANSWQQTPAGFAVRSGRAVLTDFAAAALNPSTLPRYFHTVVSTWVVGSFIAAGIAAWYLLKGKHEGFARSVMPTALGIALVTTLAMPILGHWHAQQVAATQPVKAAAFEGLYQSGPRATLMLAGWTDPVARTTTGIGIPGGLSFLIAFDQSYQVAGLDSVPASLWPPVNETFQLYHTMIAVGVLIILIAGFAWVLLWRKRLARNRFALWLLVLAAPLSMVAIQTGWAAAEVGRQPWIVWGQLKTADAISTVVPSGQILVTLALFAAVYAVLFVGWARIFFGVIAAGPVTGPKAASTRPGRPSSRSNTAAPDTDDEPGR